MDNCEHCNKKMGVPKFFAVVDGFGRSLCRNCFSNHIQEGSFKDSSMGVLSYESLSRLFLLD